jgi:Baseplate J-like protein
MSSTLTYVPQIDYTSRDYASIRDELIALIPTYAPNWVSRDPADFGMTFIELFSYMGDMLSFYIDRAANEGLLATASQRDSILEIANILGYQVTTNSPAVTTITFSNNTTSPVTIPAATKLATTTVVNNQSMQIIFETDAAVTIPARTVSGGGAILAGTATVTATQGYTFTDETVKTSTGAPNQLYALSQVPVIKNSVVVYVNGVQYTYVSSLIDSGMYDAVFTTLNDANGVTYVVFGDGISGRIPPAAGSIYVTYRVGAGAAGNVLANTLTYFLNNAVAGVTATNISAATGGADEESTDSIRFNAPMAIRAVDRAVSLKDYAYLAVQVPGVSKVTADASSFNSVIIYVAPFGDNGYASGTSGTTSAVFNSLATQILAYIVNKAAPNVTLTILPPTYVPLDVTIAINVLPQYKQSLVISQAYAAIRGLISASASYFADRVPSQYILSALSGVAGIDYSQVTLLVRPTAISYWSRTANVTTLYYPTSTPVTLAANQAITVSGVDSTVNGSYTITAIGTGTVSGTTYNTITFSNTGTTQSTPVAVTGGKAEGTGTDTVVCNINEIPVEGVFTITATGGIV